MRKVKLTSVIFFPLHLFFLQILSTIDPEVFKMKLTLYNQATEGASYSDMEVVDIRVGLTLGCIRVVFLNKFVAAILVN